MPVKKDKPDFAALRRPHMRDVVPVVFAFAIASTGIAFASYNQGKEGATLRTYYATLANQCLEAVESGCCIASVQRMQTGGFFQAVGGTCPVGFERQALRCASSYSWCAQQEKGEGRFIKGDEVKVAGTVVENVTKYLAVDGPGYVRIAEDDGNSVTIYYSNGEAPCPGYRNAVIGIGLVEGDKVQAYGQALSSSAITTCPSTDYRLVVAGIPKSTAASAAESDAVELVQ